MVTVARVLVDSPLPQLDRPFDYAVPEALRPEVTAGIRVKVPLRSAGRMIEGYVTEVVEAATPDRPLSDVDAVVSPVVVLPDALLTLARRAADRAAGSAIDILRLVIPKRMVRAEKAWLARDPSPVPVVDPPARDWALRTLATHPGLIPAVDATEDPTSQRSDPTTPRTTPRKRPGERLAVDAPPRPASEGARGAWAELLAATALLQLAAGRSTVLVLPDHRDQAQVLAALSEHVAEDAVVRDDARRSGPERYAAYLRLREPVPCIVVGNRSTVYAPAHDVGLVAIWDDGDPLLAEPLSPGVHARDAALIRQELEGSSLLFCGHTRTTDVERLIQVGWVREVPAARRESPRVILSGTREGEARGQRVPSAAFAAAREALKDGPVLVQVSRPGYAPVLICAECRSPARCPHCGGPLHARRAGAAPECGWCGRTLPGWECPRCGSERLRMASSGSERTADELGRAFPHTRVIVSDGSHPLTEVEPRPALVIATRGAEPSVAGGYRAVLLLDADRMLLAEHLRIGEDCLRWWSNAAALAAPGCPVHLVGVAGPVARALATWTAPAYARSELAERAPLMMPPSVRVTAVEGADAAVTAALRRLRGDVPELPASAVLGPVPTDGDTVRALVRFDYAWGRRVAETLRAEVVADALRGRRRRPGGSDAAGRRAPATTLRVRFDVPDLDL